MKNLSGSQQVTLKIGLVSVINSDVRTVALQGDYAYVGTSSRLVIFDVANPTAPSEAGIFDTSAQIIKLVTVEGFTYIVNGDGLRVINTSNPTIPNEVGFYNPFPPSIGGITDLVVAGDIAYLTYFLNGLHLIDISNQATPFHYPT
jgi:hypothetical protein